MRISATVIAGLAGTATLLAGCGAGAQTGAHSGGAIRGPRRAAASAQPSASATAMAVRSARRFQPGARAAAGGWPRRRLTVWLPYWNMAPALDSAISNSRLVGTASPFWYGIAGDASIQTDPGAGDRSVIERLRREGIRVVPAVTEAEGGDDFDRMLRSARRRAAMVHALLTIARSAPYSGLDLDFEDFAVDPGHATSTADAAAGRYPAFVASVCGALHAIDRSCTVTVMPRTSAAHSYWRGRLATWVYDYGALARVADRVQIMAYDDHAPGGAAGPIAPYGWVRRVIGYAQSQMPAAKTELALAAYGYDWSGAGATSITARAAPALAGENGVSPRWVTAQAEDTFRYSAAGQHHTVWYEGAAATYDRGRLAELSGLAGIDLWAAGDEQAALWPMLRALFARGARAR